MIIKNMRQINVFSFWNLKTFSFLGLKFESILTVMVSMLSCDDYITHDAMDSMEGFIFNLLKIFYET